MNPNARARTRARRYILAATLSVAFFYHPTVGVAAPEKLPSLGDAAGEDLSPAAEKRLGDEIMRDARDAHEILDDPESTEYLNHLGADLIEHAPPSPQSFHFFLVLDPDINSFALPGGFIGVNSGLIIATLSESELASVMSHEMGHVIQRHIAREITREKQTSIVALAGMVLGMVAMAKSNSPDAGEAAVAMGEGYMIQDKLNFSRSVEREADRVGFQILQDSGFDVAGMATFFKRLEKAGALYDTGAPAWLRDHPMTTERIADIQNRIRQTHYHQRPDSLEFNMIRARLRVLEDQSVEGLRDTALGFEDQLRTGNYASEAAVRYGLVVTRLLQKDYAKAQKELAALRALAPQSDPVIEDVAIELLLGEHRPEDAVKVAVAARSRFPLSRTLVWNYAASLEEAVRANDAIVFLRDQITQYHHEPRLYELIAKSYLSKGDAMHEHQALAEEYDLNDDVPAAIEQLNLARSAGGGDFYEESEIDARLKELEAQWLEMKKDKKADAHL